MAMDGIRISLRPGLHLREQKGDVDRHHDPFPPLPPFASLSTTSSNLKTNLGNRQPEISMHKRTILASESTLDDISSSVSGTGCRRDEEIGADSNWQLVVRLQPASEQGVNVTSASGQS